MKCLTGQEWMEYLETPARESLDLHIDGCARCRQERERLLAAEARLADAAERVRQDFAPRPSSLARIWDGVRFRIRRPLTPREEEQPALRLRLLRSILSEMCGRATAEGAIKSAAIRAGQGSAAPFATNLGAIVEVICGEKAARLVEHAAEGVREDLVA